MVRQSSHCPVFSIGEARSIVGDLFRPRPLVYWCDFLASLAAGVACLVGARLVGSPLSPWFWPCYCGAVLAFYRAVLFTHELTHFRKGTFRGFRVAWNALCGIPMLVPSFTYHTHLAHHARKHYGTPDDGEYLPLASGDPLLLVMCLVQPVLMPLAAIARFLVFTPAGWISPAVRQWTSQHFSSMVIDPTYVRPLPTRREARLWRLQEGACFVYLAATAVGLAAGWVRWQLLATAYAIAVGVLLLNAVRTLGAHRYRNDGKELNFTEQLLDSVNYPRWPLASELWAPVGLRFHALHHLFPSLPYHALPEAHRRLMVHLPADSPYRLTNSPGLWHSLRVLVGEVLENARRRQTGRRPPITNARQPLRVS